MWPGLGLGEDSPWEDVSAEENDSDPRVQQENYVLDLAERNLVVRDAEEVEAQLAQKNSGLYAVCFAPIWKLLNAYWCKKIRAFLNKVDFLEQTELPNCSLRITPSKALIRLAGLRSVFRRKPGFRPSLPRHLGVLPTWLLQTPMFRNNEYQARVRHQAPSSLKVRVHYKRWVCSENNVRLSLTVVGKQWSALTAHSRREGLLPPFSGKSLLQRLPVSLRYVTIVSTINRLIILTSVGCYRRQAPSPSHGL